MFSPISPFKLLIALLDRLSRSLRFLVALFNLLRGATQARDRPRFPTWMIPIRAPDDKGVPERDLRELLSDSDEIQRVFESCPMVHMARLQIVGDIHPALGEDVEARLASHYLLFIAELDGHQNDFVDHLFARESDFVLRLLGNCVGFSEDLLNGPRGGEGYKSPVYLRRYLARCTVFTRFPLYTFVESAPAMRGALELQREFSELVPSWQHLTPAELLAEWQTFVNPNPGRPVRVSVLQ